MPAISDQLLAGGCVKHIGAVHGEAIKILSGPDAGKTFLAVQETETDLVLNTDLGEDHRAKRILRFEDGQVPRIESQTIIQTEDGKRWNAVRNPLDGFLTTDFELKEIAAVDS